MAIVTLTAHFDGTQILLDEPYPLEPDTRLLVTILPKGEDDEREAWRHLSAAGLAGAYADDEAEYSSKLIKEVNPDYAGG